MGVGGDCISWWVWNGFILCCDVPCLVCSHRQRWCWWMLLHRGVGAVWELLMGPEGSRLTWWIITADRRRRAALSMPTYTQFLLSRCTYGQCCDLPSCEIRLSIMNTCGWRLLHLLRILYRVIHVFVSTSRLLWKRRFAWVEENRGRYSTCVQVTDFFHPPPQNTCSTFFICTFHHRWSKQFKAKAQTAGTPA